VNIITITCNHVNLTNIDNEIRNPDILHKESTDGVWLLNAGIVIEQGASLYINSTDTSWLKIVAPRDTETTVTGEDEEQGIVISESHNNEIYNNTVSDSGHGIDLDKASYENIIYDNIIMNIPDMSDAFFIEEGAAEQNNLYSNKLVNTNGQEIDLDEQRIERD
jgi:parallel beta-helix repeat protein